MSVYRVRWYPSPDCRGHVPRRYGSRCQSFKIDPETGRIVKITEWDGRYPQCELCGLFMPEHALE